mgnify:CR=1 FL=1
MVISGVRRNFTYLYFILNIVLYFVLLTFIVNTNIGFKNLVVLVIALTIYYVSNVFNMRGTKYKTYDIMLAISTNIFMMIFSVFSGVFRINEALIMFGTIALFQIVFKYIVLVGLVEKLKIIFIGQNEYTNTLKENLKKSDEYNLMAVFNEHSQDLTEIINIEYNLMKPDIIVDFTDSLLKDHKLVEQLLKYKLQGLQYYHYIDFYEVFERKLPVAHLDQKWFLENSGFEIYHNNFNLKLKRLFDIAFSLIIVLPIIAISAVIVKLESKGPIFFIQERIGEGNIPFKIIKFRSMTTDAEKDGPQWATKNDNRVTKWGKIMRATRIDELPQLWNVIRGEMSFVGPRPEREFFIQQLEQEMPYYNLRHTVKPGLTGWAQVMYPYGASVEDAYNKLQYDLYYIKHNNTIFDIMVILKTINIVVFGKGR